MSNIMIIEDNPVHSLLMGHIAQDLGHTDVCFSHPDDAGEKLDEMKPDLIIVDINIKGALTESIRFIQDLHKSAASRDIPVIIVSAYVSWETIKADLPFFDPGNVLEKPFTPEEISVVIKNLLKKNKVHGGLTES